MRRGRGNGHGISGPEPGEWLSFGEVVLAAVACQGDRAEPVAEGLMEAAGSDGGELGRVPGPGGAMERRRAQEARGAPQRGKNPQPLPACEMRRGSPPPFVFGLRAAR